MAERCRCRLVTKNPPLASYYIALIASFFGWSEAALHCAFLLPALAVAIGMYLVAQKYCKRPLLATLAGVLTPVYLVSSLTIMSDMMMLAFWLFAVHFWIKGIENESHPSLILAVFMIALSALTKYFGIMVMPLLLLYTIFKKHGVGWWLLYFLIPLLILAWYQWATQQLYERDLLLDAASYAIKANIKIDEILGTKAFISFAFIGGCIASILFFAHQIWSRRAVLIGLLSVAITICIIKFFNFFNLPPTPTEERAHWLLAVQLGIWGIAGISLIVLSLLDLFHRRDADSLFLSAWIIGTFVFAGFINWTVNGRSILPMIVPAGIFIARKIEQQPEPKRQRRFFTSFLPLAASAFVSLAVTWADTTFANVARLGATTICEQYNDNKRIIWFQGHWGYQVLHGTTRRKGYGCETTATRKRRYYCLTNDKHQYVSVIWQLDEIPSSN